MAEPAVRALGVRRSFRSGDVVVAALDGIDLEVARGEMVAVTGPSGSGKTTLLHCLSGILPPDEGHAWVAGTEVTGTDEATRGRLRRDHMGFVLQRLNLLSALTVEENVQLPLVLRGDARDATLQRTEEVLATVGLADRREARASELSGGQAQRVALARALVTHPAVVWADEPTGQLDRDQARDVATLLASAAAGGAAVVLVTHDAEVASVADRRLGLVDGRLQA